MSVRVRIEQTADHPLIRRLVPLSRFLEKLDTPLAQGDGDLHTLLGQDQLIRRRKEIANDPTDLNRFIGVLDSLAHKIPYPCADSRRRGPIQSWLSSEATTNMGKKPYDCLYERRT
jgi:hypothetical protein